LHGAKVGGEELQPKAEPGTLIFFPCILLFYPFIIKSLILTY
jgi:hypothetical protein